MISTIENAPVGDDSTVTFTKPMLMRFKRALNRALKKHDGNKNEVFEFDGKEFVIGYAEYVVAFLEAKLK